MNAEPISLAVATAPLTEKFGQRLTLLRDGNRAQWSCDGQTVVVQLAEDGALTPTFVDRAMKDEVSGMAAFAVYRLRSRVPYRMSAEGCSRMTSDMVDFFSGERDGRFEFMGVAEAR
jgi:hypothetical protein